jgi:hypothetical protein
MAQPSILFAIFGRYADFIKCRRESMPPDFGEIMRPCNQRTRKRLNIWPLRAPPCLWVTFADG